MFIVSYVYTFLFKMDCKKLIELVKQHEELYDVRHPRHRHRESITNLWNEVSRQLKTKDVDTKIKWQNLRSNYMRERRKLMKDNSGSVTWPYFSMMKFLDESSQMKCTKKKFQDEIIQIRPKTEADECEEMIEKEEITHEDSEEGSNFWQMKIQSGSDTSDEPLSQVWATPVCSNTVCVSGSKKRKRNTDSDSGKEKSHHHDKLSPVPGDDNDPDILFFKSLMPQIKKLEPTENLSFKVEVAQLLLRKLQPLAHPFPSSSSFKS